MATLLAGTLVAPNIAEACSCVGARMSRHVVPRDGSEAFPPNGVIRVYLRAFPAARRAALGREYRLEGPEGHVRLRAQLVGTRLDLIPREALRPATTYTLEQVHAYDDAGNLLSDDQRARARAAVRGAWFPVSRFTTARAASHVRARPLTMSSANFAFRFGGGDCGPGVSLVAEVALPQPLRDTDMLELSVVGMGVVDSVPLSNVRAQSERLYASNLSCNPDPVTIGWQSGMQVEVVLRDAAGHELGSTGRQPASGAPEHSGWQGHTRTRPDVPQWDRIEMVDAQPNQSGPTACPHGFEVVRERDLVERGGPWMYGARSTLSSDGRNGWLAFEESQVSPPGRIVRVDGSRMRSFSTTAISGIPRALAAGRRGPIVLSQTYASDASTTEGTIVALRGRRAAWTRSLGDGQAWRMAMGSRRLLAAWRAGANLAYAMYDARSGDEVRAPRRTPQTIDRGSSEGPAIAFVDDRFVVAWTPEQRDPRMQTMVIDLAGDASEPHRIAMQARSIPDAASIGRRVALVSSHQGRIQLAMLDENGRMVDGPTRLGSGTDNRIPRIASNGRFFAVGWETHPQGGVYVAALDLDGRLSPILRLDHGEPHAGSLGLAASGDGFLASFTTNYEGTSVLRTLRCRDDAPARAPARIAAR